MKALARLALSVLLAVGVAGCGQYYAIGQADAHRGFAVFLPGGGLAVMGRSPPPEPVFVSVAHVGIDAPPSRAPRDVERPRPDHLPSFDPHTARSALSRIDVSDCVATNGASRRYGHARVTMNPDGRVSKIVIDEPARLSPEEVKCVGDRLGAATVPAFKGSLVTIATTFYLR